LQVMPDGILVIVPVPVPSLVTLSCTVGIVVKLAVADFTALMATVQVIALPAHAPDQPAKVEPDDGAAVSVTLLFWLKLALQVAPQSIPADVLVTIPVPLPDLITVSSTYGITAKLAVTALAPSPDIISVQLIFVS